MTSDTVVPNNRYGTQAHSDAVEIPLSGKSGLVALIDAEDAERVRQHKWYPLRSNGLVYAYTKRPRTTQSILPHRLVLNAPAGVPVDHRDNSATLDCRKANLRLADYSQNMANRKRLPSNTTGYKGVFRGNGRYRALLTYRGRKFYLGTFDCPVMAACAYDAKAVELWGEFARPNFQFIPAGGAQ